MRETVSDCFLCVFLNETLYKNKINVLSHLYQDLFCCLCFFNCIGFHPLVCIKPTFLLGTSL